MAIGTPYKQASLSENWDAIVIGSGMGGLTAAVLLARHSGRRVLVLERHYEAGGFTHTFHRPGYQWDVGLHYIGQMGDLSSPVRRAFDYVTGGAVAWQPMPPVYDRFLIDGHRFEFASGREAFREGLRQAFPSESAAIDRYLSAVHAANRWSGLYFAEKALPAPLASLAGGLMRAPYLRWARRTTREVLQDLTANRELIGVLAAQWGDYGLPPAQSSFAMHAIIVEHYLNGAFYPVGGAASIAAAMVPLIENTGGSVVTSAEVAGIVVERGRAAGVRMSDGRHLPRPARHQRRRRGQHLRAPAAARSAPTGLAAHGPPGAHAFYRPRQPLHRTLPARRRPRSHRDQPLDLPLFRSRCECRALRARP